MEPQENKFDKLQEMDSRICKDFSYFMEKIIGHTNADFQNELDRVLSNEQLRKIAITFARGHGKSTHISVGYPLWEIAKNHNLRILLISSSSTISTSFMTEVIGHIEKNEKYKRWSRLIDKTKKGVRPQGRGMSSTTSKWTSNSIIIDREDLNLKDPTLNAVGVFGSILSKRADIIICDDLVNQVNSMTEDQRIKVIDWFYTTILPVLVPGGRLVYLGNTWHQDDLVARLLKDPNFDYVNRRPAIIHESNNPVLWEEWTSILLNETNELHIRKNIAEQFYQTNKEKMEDGVKLLWPSRFSYKELYLTRISNPYAFARMYQCDPSNRPDQRIKDEWIEQALKKGEKYSLQRESHKGLTPSLSCSGLDLAISQDEHSDDTVLLTLDKVLYSEDPNILSGNFILRNIKRGKMTPNEVKNLVKDHFEKDKPTGIRVETVGYQEAIKRDLDDMGIKVTGYHTGGEKNDPDIGVNSLAILLETGRLILPSNPKDYNTVRLISMLCNEMRSYPDGHTGDSLMALWFAYSEIRDRTSNSLVIPNLRDIVKDQPDINIPEIRKQEEKKADMAQILEQQREKDVFRSMMKGY